MEAIGNFFVYIWKILKGIFTTIIEYIYIVLLVISISFMIYYIYHVLSMPDNSPATKLDKALLIAKDFAILVFSAGIFTAALKFLQYINVFEKEFEKLFDKANFGGRIQQGIESITLKKEFFRNNANIKEIWKDITLCFYEEKYPDISAKIGNVLENKFFNNLEYYYKDQKIEYNIELIDDTYIKIEQSIIYVVKRSNKDNFLWTCGVIYDKEASYEGYPTLDVKFLNSDFLYNEKSHMDIKEEGNLITKMIKIELFGQEDYKIKRTITELQDYKKDRFWSFSSNKIVDNLDVSITFSKDLNVIFTESSGDKVFVLEKDNPYSKSYVSKKILLPGELFKLFFLKV